MLTRASYRLAVATRGGSPCRVFKHVDRILARQNQQLDACYYIDMPNTWLLYWDAPTDEEFAGIDRTARSTIDRIVTATRERRIVRDYHHAVWIVENVGSSSMFFPGSTPAKPTILSAWQR